MFGFARAWVCLLVWLFRSQQNLLIENLALRQQLAVFKVLWVWLRRLWSFWKTAIIVVLPDTVVRWHRAGFKLWWRLISRVRKRVGRRPVTQEIRELIFKTVVENGELLMLGYDVCERCVSRWMRRAPDIPAGQRWRAFLRNHREVIAAMDFFSVPTLTFNVLYVVFLIVHDRRRILHFNVTHHPTSTWIVQQLR